MNYTQMELDLIRDEGIRLRTYRCTAGHLTIGVGHKVTPRDRISEGDTISLEAAGLITVSRPIHEATGIPYGEEHYSVEVTAEGVELVEANPEYCAPPDRLPQPRAAGLHRRT